MNRRVFIFIFTSDAYKHESKKKGHWKQIPSLYISLDFMISL